MDVRRTMVRCNEINDAVLGTETVQKPFIVHSGATVAQRMRRDVVRKQFLYDEERNVWELA